MNKGTVTRASLRSHSGRPISRPEPMVNWIAFYTSTLALLTIGILQPAAKAQTPVAAPAIDHLEPGLQGQTMPDDLKTKVLTVPYSKGVRVVGHTDIFKRDTNVQLAWIDNCAYVSSAPASIGMLLGASKPYDKATAGLAVISVSDPHNPRVVGLLRDRGSIETAETLHAVATKDRKVLAAGAYAGGKPGSNPEDAAWIDIYDASNCAHPKLMAEFKWPENVHTITISPNGRRVYGTTINPVTGSGGIHVLDISDMAHPHYLGIFGATRADGTSFEFAPHEISLSPDERRIYAGVISSRGEDLNDHKPGTSMSAEGMGNDAGGIYILDNSDIVDGRPNPKMRLIGEEPHGGWHSVVQAHINGKPYLVGAGELGSCPGAWPRISSIADERDPKVVGEFKLQMNETKNCAPRTGIEVATHGIIGGPGTATSHYNDVESSTDTHMGLFNFTYAGLRIVSLRNPERPEEVAYFKPGDVCTGHVRYLRKTGDIWLVCATSGFWVLDLSPEIRSALGLPHLQAKIELTPGAPVPVPRNR